jgi:hypothetical protein
MQSEWLAWVETEKRKRLGLSFLVSLLLEDPLDCNQSSNQVNTRRMRILTVLDLRLPIPRAL